MRRCAFLTLSDPKGYVIDDALAHAPLAALGWRVDDVPWDRPGVDWDAYELVVIRSAWDYHKRPSAFLEVLEEIDRSQARLENGLATVIWNLSKRYLVDLARRGVPTVPTVWRQRLGPGKLLPLLDEIDADEVVLKPQIGASAVGTFRLDRDSARERAHEVETYFADRALLAQPFLSAVLDEGEYSLFRFDGEHSHCVRKTPKVADFRVQEEHGGDIRAVEPEPALLAAGAAALAALGEAPLYARVDLVRANDGATFQLMELELVEPSLYLRTAPGAPERFARAIATRMDRLRS